LVADQSFEPFEPAFNQREALHGALEIVRCSDSHLEPLCCF
jgi:hypothetical protein